MRATVRGVVFLALLAVARPAAAADPAQWLPGESWPGGKQADARLDEPVKLWATGMPLRDVFAQLEAQTGVHLGFDPPGDDNARLCVNAYLNPQTPPTLREVMAQLSWVLDCGFAVRGEGETREYLLLSAGAPSDFVKLYREEDEANQRRQDEAGARAEKELRAAAVSRLVELRAALALPREEAIRRYRGSDDALLLVLLDPASRVKARLITAFSEEQIRQFAEGRELRLDMTSWTPEQRAIAEAVTGLPSVEQDEYDKPWVKGGYVGVDSWAGGGLYLDWWTDVKQSLREIRLGGLGPLPLLWLRPELRFPDQTIALRHLLGEEVAPEEERELDQEFEAWNHEQLRIDRHNAVTTAMARAPGDLSPTLRARLEKLVLPLLFTKPYARWEIQQAVASASGLNVISDHFWQPRRDLGERARWLVPEGFPEPTALLLIQLASAAYDPGEKTWEWGEAGAFLRFRDPGRARWRAALLPPGLLEAVDAELLQLIPPPGESAKTVRFTIDLRPYQALVIGLSGWQLGEGRLIADGRPPDDPVRAAREQVLLGLARSQGELAFFAGFDDAHWAKLQTKGLEAASDLSLGQLGYLRSRLEEGGGEAGNLREFMLRLDPEPDDEPGLELHPPLRDVKQHLFSFKCFRPGEEDEGGSVVMRSVEITLDVPAVKQAAPGGG